MFLPGLAPEAAGTPTLFPPGTYPIMGSGDFTATLYPLAEPIPPQPVPLPTEVAPAQGPMAAGIPDLPQLIPPAPQEIGLAPPTLQDMPPGPGLSPLAQPLPTTVPDVRYPWPPMVPPIPDVQMYPPEQPRLPQVEVPPPQLSSLPGEVPPIPDTPTLAQLVQTLRDVLEQQGRLQQFGEDRSKLRAGVPEPALGKIVWEKSWGG